VDATTGSVDAGAGVDVGADSFGAAGLHAAAASRIKAAQNGAEARMRAAVAVKVTTGNYWILATWVSISALSPGFNSTAFA
jgi:hypothetical protein